jgi:histidinol-phosphate/aromatic aminotransferase/cobyric acid decarboxylase-like protein
MPLLESPRDSPLENHLSPLPRARRGRQQISIAEEGDRPEIYRMRHDVYAAELHQHPENASGELRDALDAFNVYIVAKEPDSPGKIAGFVSVTPPGHGKYSIDKYLNRDELPFACDDGLYEVRILTVAKPHRRGPSAWLLMYAALRYIESRGGRRIVAIGRQEVLGIYLKSNLEPVGRQVSCGQVTFDLLTATVEKLRLAAIAQSQILSRLAETIEWRMDIPFRPPAACFHGGAFFDAIGNEFDAMDRRHDIINADVLDAWFDPSPMVTEALREALPWLLRTSPPAGCEGMAAAISRARGVPVECVLPGAGSSDLVFLALRHWLTPRSRVLLPEPTYGEYAHILERVIGCRVDRLNLSRGDGYAMQPSALRAAAEGMHDLIVLVNPNSPTGRHMPRQELEPLLRGLPVTTRVWIDETYVEYAGPDQSLEAFAAGSTHVVVCKSMSKVYALSGVRAAYLVGPASLMADLRGITPPWAVSLPAQIAAVKALADPDYYAHRYQQTHVLRQALAAELAKLPGIEVVAGVANFLLCHLPEAAPDAATVVTACRKSGVFLRDAGSMGKQLGRHAVRIAVKSAEENRAIVAAIAQAQLTSMYRSGFLGDDCNVPR